MYLFMQINPASQFSYDYVAVDPISFRMIGFGEEYVDLVGFKERERETIERDYVATSRVLDVDLESMDDLIASCIRRDPYDLVAWMDGSGRCVLQFRADSNGVVEEVELFSNGYSKKEALVSVVMIAALHELRAKAFMLEEDIE